MRINPRCILLFIVAFSGLAQAVQLPGDPTQPANFTPVKKKQVIIRRNYTLSYIKADAKQSTAVINGTLVGVGGRVDGAHVLAIEPERVKLRTPTGVRNLVLGVSKKLSKQVSRNQD